MAPPSVRSGYVRALGHRLFYTSLGSPEKGTVLVLHGGPGINHRYLLSHFDLAPHGYQVVFYDQIGCGASERPKGRGVYGFERAADEVDAVRRALRLGRVHLLGHSYGAMLALQAIAQHPRGFRSVVLASGVVSSPEVQTREWSRLLRSLPVVARRYMTRPNPKITDQWDTSHRGAFRRLVPGYAVFGRLHVYRGDHVPWEMVVSVENMNPESFAATIASTRDWHGSGKGYDPSTALPSVRVPCLVTVGRYDQLPVGISRFAHRHIPGSRLVVFEKSAHMPHWEERDRYMGTLREFFDSVS
jgi:proline iminopeptidase